LVSDWSSDVCSSDLLVRYRSARRNARLAAGRSGTTIEGTVEKRA